ncbi:MAG: lysophospholipid acyltransferase family protein [Bacteriovoracales bacterium]|nr:lysophospholipid acyltransferase family protein [Bacteriovoracales bacterium]
MGFIVQRLFYLFVKVLHSTYRYRFIGMENIHDEKSYCFAGWHQNHIACLWRPAPVGHRHAILLSKSKSADLGAYILKRLGYLLVRGSTTSPGGASKGGIGSAKKLIKVLKEGASIIIAVDGSKGPFKKIKLGIFQIAKLSGKSIVPIVPIPERYWSLKTWDSFRIPKPFSKIIVSYGKPIDIPESFDKNNAEALKNQLARALNENENLVKAQFKEWKNLPKT